MGSAGANGEIAVVGCVGYRGLRWRKIRDSGGENGKVCRCMCIRLYCGRKTVFVLIEKLLRMAQSVVTVSVCVCVTMRRGWTGEGEDGDAVL